MKYLFKYWDNLKQNLDNKFILLFLDYDGTLTPIVESPERAVISCQTKELLKRLSRNTKCKLAIISGRALKDIKKLVGLKNIIYSGNHGLEIEGPKIKFKSSVSFEYQKILKQIKNSLILKFFGIKGILIEDKGLTLSIHYRSVDKKQIPRVKTIFHEIVIFYMARNKIKIRPGKKIWEIKPPVEWDKGKVVLWLLARQKFALQDKSFIPIYIGDDKTDEDAFKVLKNKGLTIFVGQPKISAAQYYLKNTGEAREFLKRILNLQTSKDICLN